MSAVSAEFRFEIGDLVVTRSGIAESALAMTLGVHTTIPSVFTVTGRIANQCHGGTQWQYTLSRVGQHANLFEYELEPFNADIIAAQIAKLVVACEKTPVSGGET